MRFLITCLLMTNSILGFSQTDPKDNDNFYRRRIIVGGGINFSMVESYAGAGIDAFIGIRLNHGKQIVGVGVESIFALNKKSIPVNTQEFFTNDTIPSFINYSLYSFPYRLEIYHYLTDPLNRKTTLSVGFRIGPAIHLTNFNIPQRTIGPKPSDSGFPLYGLNSAIAIRAEYAFKNKYLYLELNSGYHYINKGVYAVNKNHAFSSSIKIGLAGNFGPKLKN